MIASLLVAPGTRLSFLLFKYNYFRVYFSIVIRAQMLFFKLAIGIIIDEDVPLVLQLHVHFVLVKDNDLLSHLISFN